MGGRITPNQVVFHPIQTLSTAQPHHNGTTPDLYHRNCTTADAKLRGDSLQTVVTTHLGWTYIGSDEVGDFADLERSTALAVDFVGLDLSDARTTSTPLLTAHLALPPRRRRRRVG